VLSAEQSKKTPTTAVRTLQESNTRFWKS